jgi:hypothetical protein
VQNVYANSSAIRQRLWRGNPAPWQQLVRDLNCTIRGWATYFSYGSCSKARRAVHRHVYHAIRRFLRSRHNVAGRGYRAFSEPVVFGKLGVLPLASCSRAPLRMP